MSVLFQVRFQHEEYPKDTKQAWRQVLLIQDVEIRDRLSSSQINKLLYQYCTEARPKQTHANMVSRSYAFVAWFLFPLLFSLLIPSFNL